MPGISFFPGSASDVKELGLELNPTGYEFVSWGNASIQTIGNASYHYGPWWNTGLGVSGSNTGGCVPSQYVTMGSAGDYAVCVGNVVSVQGGNNSIDGYGFDIKSGRYTYMSPYTSFRNGPGDTHHTNESVGNYAIFVNIGRNGITEQLTVDSSLRFGMLNLSVDRSYMLTTKVNGYALIRVSHNQVKAIDSSLRVIDVPDLIYYQYTQSNFHSTFNDSYGLFSVINQLGTNIPTMVATAYNSSLQRIDVPAVNLPNFTDAYSLSYYDFVSASSGNNAINMAWWGYSNNRGLVYASYNEALQVNSAKVTGIVSSGSNALNYYGLSSKGYGLFIESSLSNSFSLDSSLRTGRLSFPSSSANIMPAYNAEYNINSTIYSGPAVLPYPVSTTVNNTPLFLGIGWTPLMNSNGYPQAHAKFAILGFKVRNKISWRNKIYVYDDDV